MDILHLEAMKFLPNLVYMWTAIWLFDDINDTYMAILSAVLDDDDNSDDNKDHDDDNFAESV